MNTMRNHSLLGAGSMLLGIGIVGSAILGPLGLGLIAFHVSESARIQLIGGEIVSLLVAAPMAFTAGLIWRRQPRLAPVLAIAAAGYAVYMYLQYIVGPQYDRYPGNSEHYVVFYLILTVLGIIVVRGAWTALADVEIALPAPAIRRTIALLLLAFNTFLLVAWVVSIFAVLMQYQVAEYHADPSLFWTVRLMDLGLVIPMAFVAGVALLRRPPWAAKVGIAVMGLQTLLAIAVASMALVMNLLNDPAASLLFLVITSSWAILAGLLYGLWVWQLIRETRSIALSAILYS